MNPGELIIYIIFFWGVLGFFAYGGAKAEFTYRFPRKNHSDVAWIMGMTGFIGFIIVGLETRGFRHGFRWRN